MNINEIYKLFLECGTVCTDTRNIKQGSLFIALKGQNFDGNKFAKEALKKGCRYAFVDDKNFANENTIFFIYDTLKTLQELARFHRQQFDIPVISITGTNGKTTSKELISCILQKKYNTTFTKENFNNHIGVPLTLLEINSDTEIAVIEMGANHHGEIKTLCEIAEPNFGLITNIGKSHLEGFGSLEGVINSKTEMYHFIKQHNGKIFINTDNNLLMSRINEILSITYGVNENCFIAGKNPLSNPFLELKWKTNGITNWNLLKTNLVGNYNFENVLSAICIGTYFNVDERNINEGITNYQPTNNRSQILKTSKNTLLIDAYNANPTSMNAALDNFFEMSGENKVLIIGDMLELGESSINEHKSIYQKIV
ncbi:MAG: UDP-N-acetylmuramoyl-tripeptide--D-alanyl-D-alanine ligase, partial [Bacteroidetes bacterium CG23_combo_of_CG06-09_8_20_14_all_32_9]